jgi:pyruvate ferredoxin oxidoreductase gamma subunit
MSWHYKDDVKEIILIGRGGMGVVTGTELLTEAAAYEDKYGQSFPLFGLERRGAPFKAYVRLSNEPILVRTEIHQPDYVVVLDVTLLKRMDVTEGLDPKTGILIINTTHSPSELISEYGFQCTVATVDADHIAMKEFGRRITNTPMLGAFSRVSGLVQLESLCQAVSALFGEKSSTLAEKNINAITEAFNSVQM